MVADCRPDEPSLFSCHQKGSRDSSLGDGSALRFSTDERVGQEIILLVALPGWYVLRVSVEAGPQGLQAQLHGARLARFAA